jgi:hypothetical protein
MAEIIRLGKVKKQRARVKESARAAENATKFGRTKAQKAFEAAHAEKAARDLDAHRRDDPEAPPRGDE